MVGLFVLAVRPFSDEAVDGVPGRLAGLALGFGVEVDQHQGKGRQQNILVVAS